MTTSDTPLQFVVTRDDVFPFDHGEIFGTMYPSHDKIGLDEWVWRLSKTVINRVRDGAGELLEVKAETVVISEGYASTAAEAAYDMRACASPDRKSGAGRVAPLALARNPIGVPTP